MCSCNQAQPRQVWTSAQAQADFEARQVAAETQAAGDQATSTQAALANASS